MFCVCDRCVFREPRVCGGGDCRLCSELEQQLEQERLALEQMVNGVFVLVSGACSGGGCSRVGVETVKG